VEYTWKIFPARDNLLKSLLGVLIISSISVVIKIVFVSFAWAILSALVLILSLQRFFFTSVYRIDDNGINAAYFLGKKYLPWTRIKTFEAGPTSAFLSPLKKISKWTLNRGMFLVYDPSEKDKIETIIKEGLKQHGAV